MAVSQIIGASIADGTIAAIDITDGTITTAKLAATTGSGNVVLSAAPTLTGNTSLVNLTVSGTQTNSTLTSGRVRYSTTGGLLTDSSNLQFDGTNLGLAVTPSAWDSSFSVFQVRNGSVASTNGEIGVAFNKRYASGDKYIANGYASQYIQTNGIHSWFYSPSGTAGNAITFTQAMTLDASGYLGIGTTSPSSYGGLAVRKAATVSSVPVSASFSDSANSTFDIRHSPNIVNLNAQGSGLTIDTGNHTQMTITSTGLVGINTTSPSQLLHLNVSSGNIYEQISSGANNVYIGFETSRTAATIQSNNPLVFDVGSAYTERMRITSAGLVGIGTTGPLYKLDVNSGSANGSGIVTILNLKNPGENYGDGAKLLFTAGASTTGGCAIGSYGTALNAADMVFYAGGNTERMRLDASGNVGIGVSPLDKLHIENGTLRISGTTAQAIYLYGAATVKPYITLNEYGIVNFYIGAGSTTSGVLSLNGGSVGSSSGLHIKASNGYVGIGTSSPSAQLNVVGGVTFQNTTLEFGNVTTSANQYILQYMASGNGYYSYMGVNGASAGVIDVSGLSDNAVFYGSRSNVPLQFLTNNTVRATITNGGNVGIGTSSPNTLLTAGATTLTGAEISTYTTSTAGGDSSKFSFWRNYTNGSSAAFRAAYISNINSDDSYNGSNAQFLGFFTKSGTAEPVERMRITSDGRLRFISPSILNDQQNARIQWVNENSNGVMAQISCVREATSGAPGALVFYTSPNVDTNSYSPIEQMRIDSSGNIATTGNLYTQSISLGPATGVSTNYIGPRNNPDSHAAASVPSYIYMGGSASVAVKWIRWNASFNSGYIAFNTHIGGVFAGERSQIDVYGNYIPTVDGTYSIGGSGTRWAAIWASNGTIQTSDLRQKTQITNSTLGLDFIKSLRPVSYKWKVGGKDVRSDFDKGKDETGNYTQIVTDIPGNRTHFGLIAQEVKEVLGDQDFGGYVHDAETDTYALRYDQFISPLIKAIQEQQALIESLTERLTALEGK